jgi:DNA-binding NtrC family response regulator
MRIEARLLVVDDDGSQREALAAFLRDLGAEVDEAGDGREALRRLQDGQFDLVITDLRMPELDGHQLLREVKQLNPEIGVLVVTAYGTIPGAVRCLRNGADDYLLKPLELDAVEHVVRRSLEGRHLRRENRELKARLGRIESLPGIVTGGGPMAEALSTIARVATSDVSVLILGESGTGKELAARAIHSASRRAKAPFVAFNGAALPATLFESELFGHERGAFTGADRTRRGRFETASGGTLFLDEIADLPAEVQVKLLRVLQERTIERVGSDRAVPVDVRIVAATHGDLSALVERGEFRADLYYRLAVVTVEIPPLRHRRADIPLLAEHFLDKHHDSVAEPEKTFSREAMDLLVRYGFPGNVRELENIVQRCMVLSRGSQITTSDLPPSVLGSAEEQSGAEPGPESGLPARVAALERRAIAEALAAEDGNQTRAAKRLCISERALRYKLKKYRDGGAG